MSETATYPTHSTKYANGFTIENYAGKPHDGGLTPPGSLSIHWPTGFDGGGWIVKDATGEIVFADAFRSECLSFAGVSA